MNLREFKSKLVGSDELEVVIVVNDDGYGVNSVEEGEEPDGRQVLWVVTDDERL